MDCKRVTINDTSSLHKNGLLVAQSSVTFTIERCSNVDLKICPRVICCHNRKFLKICFFVNNIGENTIADGILNVDITTISDRNCCRCCRRICEKFCINCLEPEFYTVFCVDLPYCRCANYSIKGQIIVNDVILKEDILNV